MSKTSDMLTRLFGASSYDVRHAIPMATELVKDLVGVGGERIGDDEVRCTSD